MQLVWGLPEGRDGCFLTPLDIPPKHILDTTSAQ